MAVVSWCQCSVNKCSKLQEITFPAESIVDQRVYRLKLRYEKLPTALCKARLVGELFRNLTTSMAKFAAVRTARQRRCSRYAIELCCYNYQMSARALRPARLFLRDHQ